MLTNRLHRLAYVPIELPGRGMRPNEPFYTEMDALVADLGHAIVEHSRGKKISLFGHSLGGLVSAHLQQELYRREIPCAHLFISATSAPARIAQPMSVDSISDAEFRETLSRTLGEPNELPGSMELIENALPRFKADLKLAGAHFVGTINCPLTVISGLQDPIAPADCVAGWKEYSNSSFTHLSIDAGHQYLRTHRQNILEAVGLALT